MLLEERENSYLIKRELVDCVNLPIRICNNCLQRINLPLGLDTTFTPGTRT